MFSSSGALSCLPGAPGSSREQLEDGCHITVFIIGDISDRSRHSGKDASPHFRVESHTDIIADIDLSHYFPQHRKETPWGVPTSPLLFPRHKIIPQPIGLQKREPSTAVHQWCPTTTSLCCLCSGQPRDRSPLQQQPGEA